MDIYDLNDYKAILRALVQQRRSQFGSRYTFDKVAQACGVQKTYFSKVLNGLGNLNPDQLYSACEFLKIPSDEIDYILLVREWQLADHKTRKQKISLKLSEIRRKQLKTESSLKLDTETLQTNQWEYYTDLDMLLVHLFMTIPVYSAQSELICQKLRIPKTRLDSILLKLQNLKMIEHKNQSYMAKEPNLHLSQDSPVFGTFGTMSRLKALEKISQSSHEKNDNYVFSTFFSSAATFQIKFKKKLLQLLKEAQKETLHANAQEVFQLNIDFIKWS